MCIVQDREETHNTPLEWSRTTLIGPDILCCSQGRGMPQKHTSKQVKCPSCLGWYCAIHYVVIMAWQKLLPSMHEKNLNIIKCHKTAKVTKCTYDEGYSAPFAYICTLILVECCIHITIHSLHNETIVCRDLTQRRPKALSESRNT